MSMFNYSLLLEDALEGSLGFNDTFTSTTEQSEEFRLLVFAVKNNDKDAFSSIYDTFASDVYRYIYFKAPKEEAEDLTAEVFLKVWEKFGSFRGNSWTELKVWIIRIAHNMIVDFYRKRKEVVELEETEDTISETPEKALQEQMTQAFVHSSLSQLPEKQQEILKLRYLHELETNEIAALLKTSEGNVRILVHRALKELKELLVVL